MIASVTPSLARWARRALLALLLLGGAAAHAEPYLAIANGLKCVQCHVNPTGGGLRSNYGDVFSQYVLPATHLDAGTDNWTGDVTKFLRVGGDLRYDFTSTQEPHTPTVDGFQMQQTRVYLEANVIPDRLLVYADEQVAPGGALDREAWVMYWSKSHDWYIKAGQMYLPFGFRLQDQSAFVQQLSGINMTTPDNALEVGWLRGPWDLEVNAANGTAAGPATGLGKQYTLQLSFVQPIWRLGAAASDNDAGGGHRQIYGLFAGLHTGPVTWLAEADMVENRPVAVTGIAPKTRSAAGLIEADISPWRGHNLKLTFEYLDPDADIQNNGQNRWSVVYELTPFQFLQLRAGVRRYQGIPQSDVQNQVQTFLEAHGFF